MSAAPQMQAPQTCEDRDLEWARCEASPEYFIATYVQIKHQRRWVPFALWPAQSEALHAFSDHKKIAVLKARQNGLSWLALAYGLWRLIFRPGSTVLVLSLREEEALALVRDRLKPMFSRLPEWMRPQASSEGVKHWTLEATLDDSGNPVRSVCVALPSNRGDSYSADVVIVDEADLIPRLGTLLESVEPTIEDNPTGHLFLISRVNPDDPGSAFQRIYSHAVQGEGDWHPVFLGWRANPNRTDEWHRKRCAEALERDGSLDAVRSQYPETPEEALAPRSQNKRIPPRWMEQVTDLMEPQHFEGAPALPGLRLYVEPVPGRAYIASVDPSEGLETGDASPTQIVDKVTGEQCAVLDAHLDPTGEGPRATAALCRYYNKAPAIVERNNHGHAYIAALHRLGVQVLPGPDGKPGWNATSSSKPQGWDVAASAVREVDCIIHDRKTALQVGAIDRTTLAHPGKRKGATACDDLAQSWMLAMVARAQPGVGTAQAPEVPSIMPTLQHW